MSNNPYFNALVNGLMYFPREMASQFPNQPQGGVSTGPIQKLGTAANLIPSLMAGSGASQAAPVGSANAAPVSKPPIGSFLAPGVAGSSAPAPSVPLPQPRPAMANGPMSLSPPGAGFLPATPNFYNGPGSMSFGASPVIPGSAPSVMPQPSFAQEQPGAGNTGQLNYQPTGLIPRAVNDFNAIKKLFAGAGPFISGAAIF